MKTNAKYSVAYFAAFLIVITLVNSFQIDAGGAARSSILSADQGIQHVTVKLKSDPQDVPHVPSRPLIAEGKTSSQTVVGDFGLQLANSEQKVSASYAPGAQSLTQLYIPVSGGETIKLTRPAATVFIAEPSVADVQTPSNQTIFVFGKKPGRTTLVALDEDGNEIIQYIISVSEPFDELRDFLRREVSKDIHVVTMPRGMLLKGNVKDPDSAEFARQIASQYLAQGGVLINRLKVEGRIQVNLRVRIAEISRDINKQLGFNWQAAGSLGEFMVGLATGRTVGAAGAILRSNGTTTASNTDPGSAYVGGGGKNFNITALVDALAADGVIHILSQPNLTTTSGEAANILVGGEFPIPISNGVNGISVDYRRFGVSLDFVPTVLSNKLISMRIKPEVSQLSNQGAVQLNGFNVPSLEIRRAETTVELASGQSFAIAGLINSSDNNTINSFPGAGDLPVLGALFRSTAFQRQETELVIIVTPYIVRPTFDTKTLTAPTDSVRSASDAERILNKKLLTVSKKDSQD